MEKRKREPNVCPMALKYKRQNISKDYRPELEELYKITIRKKNTDKVFITFELTGDTVFRKRLVNEAINA